MIVVLTLLIVAWLALSLVRAVVWAAFGLVKAVLAVGVVAVLIGLAVQ